MPPDRDTLYLSAPVNALVEGIFQADTTLGEIRRHGDLALGTFNHLDGELVMLDGRAYQVAGDGAVRAVPDDICSPFVVATFFRELSRDELPGGFDGVEALFGKLRELLPSPNMMLALRIEARFSFVRTRSVPRQESYRPLVEITKDQPTFERRDVSGSLIGFYTPAFMSSLNVPGFHLHFLSTDLAFGGHLLQCRADHAIARVQILRRLCMELPASLAYLTADFSRNTAGDLAKAETESPGDRPADAALTLRNDVEELARLTAWLEEQAVALSFPPPLLATLNLALEEWVVNVITYAYPDQAGHEIGLKLWREPAALRLVIEDDGRPFDPTAQPEADTSLPLEQRGTGGLGIHFIRRTMDRFAYRRENGRNIVTLTKAIAGPGGNEETR